MNRQFIRIWQFIRIRQLIGIKASSCLVFLGGLLLATSLAAEGVRGAGASANAGQRVSVCVSRYLSPQIFAMHDGQPTGYLYDVVSHAGSKAGWEMQFVADTPTACKSMSIRGEVDLVYPLDEENPQAAGAELTREHIDFSWARVYTLRGNHIKALDNLAGMRIGLSITDSLLAEIPYSLTALGINANYQQFDSFHVAIEALHQGRVDAVAGENTTLFIASDIAGVEATPLRFALKKFYPGSYNPASFNKVKQLDVQLEAMHDDPAAPIYKRYSHWISPSSHSHVSTVENMITALVLALVFIAFSIAWVFRRRLHESDSALASNSLALAKESRDREAAQAQAELNSDRFHRLSHATRDIIFDWDIENNTYWQNEAAKKVLGSSEEILELIQQNGNWFQDRLHPDDQARVRSVVTACIARRSHVDPIEFRLRNLDGEYIHVRESIDYSYNDNNMVTRALVSLTDISALHDTMGALVDSEQRFSSLVGNVPGVVVRVNIQAGRVIEFISNSIEDILGITPADMIGKPTAELAGYIHPDDIDKLMKDGIYDTGGPGPYLQEFRMVDVQGLVHWVSIRSLVSFDDDGNAAYADMTIFDVTDFVQLSDQLNRKSMHDDLTGLLNRKGFEKIVDEAIGKSQDEYAEHCLCHIDIDQFKAIQEQFGYAIGDQLLRKFSRHLMRFIGEKDNLACLGGDRFAILFSDCSSGEACRMVMNLLEHIQSFEYVAGEQAISVSASIGQLFITLGMQGREVETVMGHADTACYMAKAQGGNRAQLYSVADSRLSGQAGEVKWYSVLKQACEEGAFELFYEPVIAIDGSVEQNCAALQVRMSKSSGLPSDSEDFKWVAERHGFAAQIELWAVTATCDWLQGHGSNSNFDMFTLEISASTLANEKIRLALIRQLAELPSSATRLCFEINEHAALENLPATGEFLQAVHDSGCKATLVCYESGLSSFNQLKSMTFDFLKSEGHGHGDLVKDVTAIAMVRALNEVAHALGMRSIVGCVESESTLRCLRDIPVDFVQGGYFGDAQVLPSPSGDDKPADTETVANLA